MDGLKIALFLCALLSIQPETLGQLVYGGNNVCFTLLSRQSCHGGSWWSRETCNTRYYHELFCCEGWSQTVLAVSVGCDVPWCILGWNLCPNGGTCTDYNYCQCTDNYYSPNCDLCGRITNCQDMQYYCTTSSDQQCRRCEYTVNDNEIKAYQLQTDGGYSNRICTQLCSWRDDSKRCYPGECTGDPRTPDTCSCAPGFSSSSDCMTIVDYPDITSCIARASTMNGNSESDYVETDCDYENNPTTYSNHDAVNRITVTWTTRFEGPSVTDYPLPYYIYDFEVGIIEATVDWYHKRGSSTIRSGTIDCTQGSSRSNPDMGIHSCNYYQAISTSWAHGDVLEIQPESVNGGFLQIKNYDNGLSYSVETEYYNAPAALTHFSSITFDFEAPVHCSATSTCSSNILEVGAPYTQESVVNIGWYGWVDDLSGIAEYDIEVYKFSPFGSNLGYTGNTIFSESGLESLPSGLVPFTFTEPGVYCFLLTVVDAAANFQHARRFVLFDDTNVVEISSLDDDAIIVTSAAENATYLWQTNLDEQVSLNWVGHFYNEAHDAQNFLAPINDHHVTILPEYEEVTGQPHAYRSEEGIPHVNGIVGYQLAYAVDHEGGRSITELDDDDLFELQNFQPETHSMTITREDGDSVRLWIKGWDVMNNTAVDSVLIHVDSTPPEIELQGLFNNGEYQLAVHSLLELYDLSFYMEAFDYHSGLREVYWQLHDLEDTSIIHGSGQLAASNIPCDTCTTAYCYEIPKDEECYNQQFILEPDAGLFNTTTGVHDYDYVFRIVVTNNAWLVSTAEFQITVDTTAPEPGSVLDSAPGQPDKDYQTSTTVHASWSAFFDQESGVMLYKYIFNTSCATAEDFTSDNDLMEETTETFASFADSAAGTYHTTVIAYNRAMEASTPVCSDGVTIDDTVPLLGNIYIEQMSIKEGLIRDSDGNVAYLDNDVQLHDVLDPSADCRSRALLVDDLSKYGQYLVASRAYANPECDDADAAGEYMFLGDQFKLEMAWSGSDNESSPLAYEVCVGSTSTAEDIIPCTSTNGHDHFLTYHVNLGSNELCYIQVKATNKAGLTTTQVFGPVVVKISGPEEVDDLEAELTTEADAEYVHASWTYGSEYDAHIETSFLHSVHYAIGETDCVHNHADFTELDASIYDTTHCTWQAPPTCLSIPVSSLHLHLHRGSTYCIIVKLLGTNGVATYQDSSFTYHHGDPVVGTVIEIAIDFDGLVLADIDYQTTQTSLSLEYIGAQQATGMEVDLEVAIGTSDSLADVVDYMTLELTDNTFTFDGLSLAYYEKYYVLVRATDVDSELASIASSDGVTVLPPDGTSIDITLNDGEGCPATEDDIELTDGFHHENAPDPTCGEDIDYQAISTSISTNWVIPAQYLPYIITQHISLYKQQSDGSLVQVHPTVDMGVGDTMSITGLSLEAGVPYMITLRACHMTACYEAVTSDGVTILPDAPVAQPITSGTLNNAGNQLSLTWTQFTDMYISGSEFINRYDVSIYVRHTEGEQEYIRNWITLDDSDISTNGNSMSTTMVIEPALHSSACLMVAVRGYSFTGLHSTGPYELAGCEPNNPDEAVVLDARGTIDSDGNTWDIAYDVTTQLWTEPEREFTRSLTTLSAVWPDLRHGQFYWKVVSSDAVEHWAYYRHGPGAVEYDDFHSTAPEVLDYGESQGRYINIHNLTLEEGQRYYVCVNAPAVTLVHEQWDEPLDAVSGCTNGIVVDSQAPVAGQVWMGRQLQHQMFTTEGRELVVQWTGFQDAEVYADTMHDTAISHYTVSFGTEPRGTDVVDAVNVGITNYHHFRGLTLEEGRPYYATVTANDFVSHSTSSSSLAVYIDTTPPVFVENTVQLSEAFLTSEQDVQVDWDDSFYDRESGVSEYYWCVGTQPGLCDRSDNTQSDTASHTLSADDLSLADGQHYYITIQAVNGAGLVTTTSSAAFVVDTSSPVAGIVTEISTDSTDDIDYQAREDILQIKWDAFYDRHVQIYNYILSIGSCNSCSDVLAEIDMGLKTEFTIEHLELANGVRYYTTITACSVAGLCTSSTSDGVIIDTTPPHIAQVLDGNKGTDIDYQSSRTLISAELVGQHDTESGLRDMSVWLSIVSNDAHVNVTDPRAMHVHNTVVFTLDDNLAENQRYYINVELCNNVGLCTVKQSNGFIVDSSAPVVHQSVAVTGHGGSINLDTQVWLDAIIATWDISDDISPVLYCTVAITTDTEFSESSEKIKLYGEHSSYKFTDLDLHDGDLITVIVTTCNNAQLCTTSASEPTLVDNSVPTIGAFAINTTHSVNGTLQLSRSAADHMLYSHIDGNTPAQIHLSWIGFLDPHSDIEHYYVTIGTTYHGNELVGNDRQVIEHESVTTTTEGYLQTTTVNIIGALSDNDQLYITIQAQNYVGLKSSILHGLFETIPSGSGLGGQMHLIRRCDTETCESHCTCAPHGRIHCALAQTCTDVSGDISYANIEVLEVDPSSMSLSDASDITYIISTDTLSARWNVGSTGMQPMWFEWSVSIEGNTAGTGLLNLQSQPVWFDNMQDQHAVFTIATSHLEDLELASHTSYVFHVKAWYSDEVYAVATSNGVEIDSSAPLLSSTYKLNEVINASSSTEIDFTTDPSHMYLKWTNVFRDGESGLNGFTVCIGTEKGTCNVAMEDVDETVTEMDIAGLSLDERIWYHSSVTACNRAALCEIVYSDGFKVDTSPPTTGYVQDGSGLYDELYSTDTTTVSATWNGVYDDDSYISHYIYCVTLDPTSSMSLVCNETRDQSASIVLELSLDHDTTLFSVVSAIDGAELESAKIYSNGVTIDLTPPQTAGRFESGSNIVTNPSFEDAIDGNWTTVNDQYEINTAIPQEGLKYICLTDNEVYQTLNTVAEVRYRVSFAAKRSDSQTAQPSATCYLKAGSTHEMYVLSDKTNSNESFHEEWIYHHVYFHASSSETPITFGTKENKLSICFDNVEVQELSSLNGTQIGEEGVIHVKLRTAPQNTELVATWNVQDLESTVVETLVGLGTVRGGVQIADFKSVGHQSTYRKTGLNLQHGTAIYTTLKVTNGAGLFSVFYGSPVVVDITPPEITTFQVGAGGNVLTSYEVEITWQAEDEESGIEVCWVSGVTEDGSVDVLEVQEISDTGSQHFAINDTLAHGQTMHFLLRCKSNIGLVSAAQTHVITMVTQAPDVENAQFTIIHESQTIYPERGQFVSSLEHIWLKWVGVRDDVDIAHCEVNFANVTNNDVSWLDIGYEHRRFISVQNLDLEDGRTYDLTMRCENIGGFTSDVMTTRLTVETSAPVLTGADIQHEWINENTLRIDWSNCYGSSSDLTYQIHAGTVLGGADVLKWADTSSTSMEISQLDNTLQYYITVVAINMAGLYTSHTFEVDGN